VSGIEKYLLCVWGIEYKGGFCMSNKSISLGGLIEGAIMAALAMALSYIPHDIGGLGIQIQWGILPLVLVAERRGWKIGVVSGVIWGVLDAMLRGGSNLLNPVQIIMEYPVAFGVLGLAGLVAQPLAQALKNRQLATAIVYIFIGGFIGTLSKYFFHFVAGVFYWGSYAPKGWNVWLFSLYVNGISGVLGLVYDAVVLAILVSIAPQLFSVSDNNRHIEAM
jgi:thiamine transporter